MNRRQEYDDLLRELERPAALDAVERARKRLRRRRMWTRPALGFAAAAMTFVLLVNFCAPVAQACAEIPVLKELAQLVSFSSSLTDQLNHGGAQKIDQTQEENGASVYVDSLIVDQKRMTVFYRIDTDIAERAIVSYGFLDAEGYIDERFPAESYGWTDNERDVLNNQMRSATFDFGDSDVPEELYLQFNINLRWKDGRPLTREDDVHALDTFLNLGDFDARLTFHLRIEPQRIVQGYEKKFGQELTLDGQTYSIEQVNVYSSKAEIYMRGRTANTAWLQTLEFHLECEDGTILGQNVRDTLWEGGTWSKDRKYYCESPFYHMPSGKIKLVITGASWLDKDHQMAGVNLKTGEMDGMPDNYEFDSVREEDGAVVLRLRQRHSDLDECGVFAGGYGFTPDRMKATKDWRYWRWETWMEDGEDVGRMADCYFEPDQLDGDWVYFVLDENRYWRPDEPIVVELSMAE